MTPETWMQIAERFGFPAAASAFAACFIWVVGRNVTAELGRLTRAVTLSILAMQFAPEFHEEAERLYQESVSEAHKRKENIETELARRKHPKP